MNTTATCLRVTDLYILFGAIFLTTLLNLSWTADARAAEPVAPKLTPKLQKLFAEEMVAILNASQQIVAALSAGDHAVVAKNAQAIHDSFILDKNLTAKDRHELETAVPAAFLDLDGAFHQMAAKLAEAAQRQDLDLQTHYFSRMLETCQICHSRYATDKFPGFGSKAPATHAH